MTSFISPLASRDLDDTPSHCKNRHTKPRISGAARSGAARSGAALILHWEGSK